jgi:UDP-GlcNAc:undecaprenyl-phosphate GlcNAc-1-phosphate transferase
LSTWLKEKKVRSKFQINVLGKYDYLPMLIGIGVLVIPQVRRGFMDIGLRWVYILSLSFAVSFALTPVFGRLAARFDVIDRPNERKVHLAATPLLGGAAVFIAFLVSILLNGIFTTKLGIILIASTILFTIGVLDDVKELPAGTKLAAQLLCSALVMGAGIYLKVVPNSLGLFALEFF